MTVHSGAALGRLIRRATSDAFVEERCDLCGAPLPSAHRHVLDLGTDQLRCACQACTLLFERNPVLAPQRRDTPGQRPLRGQDQAGERYRLVPQRRMQLDPGLEPVEVGVPVGLAFFAVQPDGSVLARYPSPVGATAWELDATMWSGLLDRWPELGGLMPSVEALLVNTARGRRDYWIVPIDECYRLVTIVRTHWKGLSGGRDVWPAVDRFFAELDRPRRRTMATG